MSCHRDYLARNGQTHKMTPDTNSQPCFLAFIVRHLIAALLFFAFESEGQRGNYFLTNLAPTDEEIDPRSTGIAQNELGIIYFTNKNGILEFDGNDWRLVPTDGSVYTILSYGNQIFAGGSFGFGVMIPETGKGNDFQLISNKPNIFSAIRINDKIYFCSEAEIFTYDISSKELGESSIAAGDSNFFLGLTIIGENPYVTSMLRGLQLIGNKLLSPSELKLPEDQDVIFSISVKENETLIGTDRGKLFHHRNGESLKPVHLEDSVYVSLHGLVNATLAGENLVALGTLKGGVIFIDPQTGSTKEIIDYHTGLPDNDVLALFTDRNKGVWAAHEYGFTRIAPSLPFRTFNYYPGLAGNLLCVKEVDTTLYVGTSLGLYYLKAEDQYEEVEVVQRSTRVLKSNTAKGQATVTPVEPQPEKTRKKLFGFLRKKKEDEPQSAVNTTRGPKPGRPQTETVVTRTTKKVLKSRQFVYKQLNGVTGKVTQMIEYDGITIVGGLGGVFSLKGATLTSIFREPVRYVFHSNLLDQLFVSTYDDRTLSLTRTSDGWEETHYADTLRDYISYIFEDHQANIWFCGKTKIYKMELVDRAIVAFRSLPIHNPLYDETVGISLGHDVYVAASGVFKRYDGNGFVNYDSLPGPRKYFASQGNFWFSDGHRWRTINRQLQELKLEWLGLFPNLRYLSPSNDGAGLWMVTAKNELYKFENPTDQQATIRYPLFLRDIKGEQIRLREKDLRMDQSENAIYFEFTQPNFLGFKATEFRYLVHGLTNEWSEWSNVNNLIPFSYLPPGEYQLAVQSRDILGNESEVELVTFEVLPYYWKRWWFYALEFTFVSMLVYMSIQLGRRDDRYKLVSQILSLLTVILLIQFFETGIDSLVEVKSSPVVEFLIQLGITLVVFPVESKLRQFMKYVSARKYGNS